MTMAIKNVSKESWTLLRSEAIKHGTTTGKMLEIMVEEHVRKEERKGNWDVILSRKVPILTKEEANRARKRAEGMRRNFRLRI